MAHAKLFFSPATKSKRKSKSRTLQPKWKHLSKKPQAAVMTTFHDSPFQYHFRGFGFFASVSSSRIWILRASEFMDLCLERLNRSKEKDDDLPDFWAPARWLCDDAPCNLLQSSLTSSLSIFSPSSDLFARCCMHYILVVMIFLIFSETFCYERVNKKRYNEMALSTNWCVWCLIYRAENLVINEIEIHLKWNLKFVRVSWKNQIMLVGLMISEKVSLGSMWFSVFNLNVSGSVVC